MQARISYQLPEPGTVILKIYNIQGQLVRTLVDEYKPAGYHYEVWNGRNENGREIASGIYTYRLESNNFSASRKMVLLK
jgi:flagellar hook assembly protein FlgD